MWSSRSMMILSGAFELFDYPNGLPACLRILIGRRVKASRRA
jgi:hypothetical protein